MGTPQDPEKKIARAKNSQGKSWQYMSDFTGCQNIKKEHNRTKSGRPEGEQIGSEPDQSEKSKRKTGGAFTEKKEQGTGDT